MLSEGVFGFYFKLSLHNNLIKPLDSQRALETYSTELTHGGRYNSPGVVLTSLRVGGAALRRAAWKALEVSISERSTASEKK